jgi:pyrroloquinoline quinone (PQQ) biosynthesis protein C
MPSNGEWFQSFLFPDAAASLEGILMASIEFRRRGPLKDLASYPQWLRDVVRDTEPDKERVVNHPVFTMMREGTLPLPQVQRFLTGGWLTIERFPQFMALNLQKMQFGDSVGGGMARSYLIRNIRVEQKHADHWLAWAEASGLSLADLRSAKNCAEEQALAHWCWYISAQPSLAVGIAATNYAVEGATGEWSCLVCAKDNYAKTFPESCRVSAMRWLKVHAEYDDTHPWEALDIVATLMGNEPSEADVDAIRTAVRTSFNYMELGVGAVLRPRKTETVYFDADSILELVDPEPYTARRRNRRNHVEKAVLVS